MKTTQVRLFAETGCDSLDGLEPIPAPVLWEVPRKRFPWRRTVRRALDVMAGLAFVGALAAGCTMPW
jgi:hypothetical protein